MSVKRFIAVNLLLQLECIISSPFLQIYCIVTACLIYKFIYMLLLFLGYAVRNTITWQLAVLYSSCLRFNVFYDSDYESTVFFFFLFSKWICGCVEKSVVHWFQMWVSNLCILVSQCYSDWHDFTSPEKLNWTLTDPM